jgi:hypothetical protein
MYVVFAEEREGLARIGTNTVTTLEEAFARIACRCGLSYRFVAFEGGLGTGDDGRGAARPQPGADPVLL